MKWNDGTPKSSGNAFDVGPKRKPAERKPSTKMQFEKNKQYQSTVALMNREERIAYREKLILRENMHTDLGAHGGLTKGQRAPR